MQLRVLGASGGFAHNCATTSFLLDEHILLDGGTGVSDLSLEQMYKLDAMLLTHAHLDHIAGVALMLASVIDKRSEPFKIYAPAVVLNVLKTHIFNWQVWPDFSQLPSASQPILQFCEVEPNQPFKLFGLEVEAVALTHTVPSFAYILSLDDKRFCFCGDTAATQALWSRINALKGVEKIFIELSFPASHSAIAKVSGHYDVGALATDLVQLEYSLDLHIMHAKPGYEQQLLEEVAKSERLQNLNVKHCRAGDRITVL